VEEADQERVIFLSVPGEEIVEDLDSLGVIAEGGFGERQMTADLAVDEDERGFGFGDVRQSVERYFARAFVLAGQDQGLGELGTHGHPAGYLVRRHLGHEALVAGDCLRELAAQGEVADVAGFRVDAERADVLRAALELLPDLADRERIAGHERDQEHQDREEDVGLPGGSALDHWSSTFSRHFCASSSSPRFE
jgi:hypothetical protein